MHDARSLLQSAELEAGPAGCARGLELVIEAVLREVERDRRAEDRDAILFGHHAARGEALAVADRIDLVDDLLAGVARPEKISVQAMRHAQRIVHGADGGIE